MMPKNSDLNSITIWPPFVTPLPTSSITMTNLKRRKRLQIAIVHNSYLIMCVEVPISAIKEVIE